MEVRYSLAVVTGGGGGLGREVALALSRLGAAVVVADRDRAAAERTVEEVRQARVQGWAVQADLAEEYDVRLLAARVRDLGGADVLVDAVGEDGAGAALLTELFLEGLDDRRGRRQPGVVVHVARGAQASVAARAVVDRVRSGRSGRVGQRDDGTTPDRGLPSKARQ